MKRLILLLLPILLMFSCSQNKTEEILYPVTYKTGHIDNYFGVEIADPYNWFETDTTTRIREWISAQNDLTYKYLGKIPYRNKIRQQLESAWDFPKQSAPFKSGGKYFIYKNNGLQNQSALFVMNSACDTPKLLLDPNLLSSDGTTSLTKIDVSPDGKLLAYSVARSGSDWNTIYFMNIETLEKLNDSIVWMKFSGLGWHGNGVYYSGYSPPEKGKEYSQKNEFHKLFYHKLNTPQSEDKIVMENKKEPLRNFYASVSDDGNYLLIYSSNTGFRGNALSVKDLRKADSAPVDITGEFDFEFSVVGNTGADFYIKTNKNAKKYKLVKVNLNNAGEEYRTDIIPESGDVLSSVSLCSGKIVASYFKDARSQLNVYNTDGTFCNTIGLPALGTVSAFNSTSDDSIAFYEFSSYNYPATTFLYNTETNESKLYYKPEIDFDGSNFEVKQVFYESKDKTMIPMFIVHKKGIDLNGKNPVILYGYGGFNRSMTPGFSISRAYWLKNGGVYAVANLRGGGEYGEEWHLAGTKLKKQNVFDDFIAAAEYLIKEKYTSSEYLTIQGGSNGGLLVGAVINQRPELFKVALPAVGVMDMLKFHKFTIGWSWITDYGSSDNKEEFEYILKYSPLHNIDGNRNYPAVLVTTADHDDRVVPAHSFKYIAALQEKYKGNNPALIRIETKAGHGAGKPTAKIIDEAADVYAFIFYNMGIAPE